MTSLGEWLEEDQELGARLEVMARLCQSLEEFRKRQPGVRPALNPASIVVSAERAVTLSVAREPVGEQVPEYRAPETLAGEPYEATADIYSVGVLCYEILTGRHPFVMTTPLGSVEAAANVPAAPIGEVRHDVPRDLADAVMPCLDRDREWRPKDLSYLVEMLAKARRLVPPPGRRKPASRSAAPSLGLDRREPLSAARKTPPAKVSRLPVLAAAGAGAVLLIGGLWYLTQPAQGPVVGGPVAPSAPTRPADTPLPTAVPGTGASPQLPPPATPTPLTIPSAAPTPALASPSPTPAPALPSAVPTARAEMPTPEPRLPPSQPPAATPASETPTQRPSAAPLPVVPSAAPEDARPAVLTTVVPGKLKRGATILVDVRGSGLRADHQVRIQFKGREAADIQVAGQRFMDAGLMKVLLKVDGQAREGGYTLLLTDAHGRSSNARPLEVGR